MCVRSHPAIGQGSDAATGSRFPTFGVPAGSRKPDSGSKS
jgi:hypothetical protein